ncbi:MAG: hypothetical protein ACJ79T_04490 [Myxococcales bacterium]
MKRRHAALAALFIAAAACSGGSSGGASQTKDTGGSGSGAPVADAGTDGTGAPADAGSTPDAGTAAGPDAGSAPDAGSPADAGSPPDAGAGATGATADLCPGTPSATSAPVDGCSGVVPAALGSSFSFIASDPNTIAPCTSTAGDESGNVAVAFGDINGGTRFWHLYGRDGTDRGRLTAYDLYPQGCGFEGVFNVAEMSDAVGSWSPDTARKRGPPAGGDIIARTYRASPQGMLTVLKSCSFFTDASSIEIQRVGPAADLIARLHIDSTCTGSIVAAAGTDAVGNILLLAVGDVEGRGFAPDALTARWYDFDLSPLTNWFLVAGTASRSSRYATAALVGGGIAIQVDGAWTLAIASGQPVANPAPAFLAANGPASVALVRGARAYAVLPVGGALRLYSAAGELCGSLSFPGTSLTMGADGSVIAASGTRQCTKTVWPALLR